MNNACLFIICQETGNKVAMEVVSSEDRLALEQAGNFAENQSGMIITRFKVAGSQQTLIILASIKS